MTADHTKKEGRGNKTRRQALDDAANAVRDLYNEASHNASVYQRDGRHSDARYYEDRAAAFARAEERIRGLL